MKKNLFLLGAAAILLAACTGTRLQSDGAPKGELHWPEKVTLGKHKGTFVNLANLANVQAGATRDELYRLLGRPHFSEGFHSREWDYLFYFRTPGRGQGGISSCQFKVLFDRNEIARHFYWKALEPADGQCPPKNGYVDGENSHSENLHSENLHSDNVYTLGASALFSLDSSALSLAGAEELKYLSEQLRGLARLHSIRVTGYTDRLGNEAYNQRLSQKRAMTVRRFLIEQGMPAELIIAEGKGENEPLQKCPYSSDRAALIACLAPNRRIEVVVNGSGYR